MTWGEGGVGTKTTDYVNKGGVSEKFIYFPNNMELMMYFWIKCLYFQYIGIYKLYQTNKYSRGIQNDKIYHIMWAIK